MKIRKLALFALLILASCSSVKEAPTIYFSNATSSPIIHVQCRWNKKLLTLARLNPGDSRSQTFQIKKQSEFFGPISVSYENQKGEVVSKKFSFKKENMPSISEDTYNYVQFYFTHDDIEVVASDAPDITGKARTMDKILKRQSDAFSRYVGTASLIPDKIPCDDNFVQCRTITDTTLIRVEQ